MEKPDREPMEADAEVVPVAWTNGHKPARGGTFTRFVRALSENGEALSQLVEEMLKELRDTLMREMRKTSLWSSPPRYVGIYGHPHWTSRGPSPALEGLLSDCYLFVFKEKLHSLVAGLKVNNAIDGLVVFYVGNFLFERRKDHDPLGYRVFENTRKAVRNAVAGGELHVLEGDPKIRNNTVLGATPAADPDAAAEASELAAIVARWNHDLLPDLVVAERAARGRVTARLKAHLLELEAEGIDAFRFKDLVDALKQNARALGKGLFESNVGEEGVDWNDDVSAVAGPFSLEARLEDLDSFKALIECVAALIERSGGRRKRREYLTRLWSFLRRFAVVDDAERLPSNRRLGEALRIPRERFKELYDTLGQLIRRCQATLAGDVVELAPERRDG